MNLVQVMYALLLSLLFSGHVFAATLNTKTQQNAALDAIIAELQDHYGMEKYKKWQFGITLPGLRKKYRTLIRTATTLEELAGFVPKEDRKILSPRQFQLLMVGLAADLRDGHTNISTKKLDLATLGIYTAALDGRLFVTGFSENFYNGEAVIEKVKIGDEIVSLDGEAVQDIAERNMLYVQDGTYAARMQTALERTVSVPYSVMPEKREGDAVEIEFRRGERVFEGSFNWIEASDFFQLRSMFPNEFPDPSKAAEYDTEEFIYGRSGLVRSYFREGIKSFPFGAITDLGMQLNVKLEDIAKKQSRRAGEQSIKPTKRIPAYIVHYKGKNIGVIRIPSYSPSEIGNEYMWVLQVLNGMKISTDMLIIDQLGNSGGSVALVLKWMGLFANGRSLSTVSTDTKISETMIGMYSQALSSQNMAESGGPHRYSDRRMSEREVKYLRKLYESGEVWTGLRADWGSLAGHAAGETGWIYPDVYSTYDKPILLLNDSRSASGGDFFPAMMQQNDRAIIMGETSKGLGGPVYRSTESMPGSEVSMRCTSGYCERPDGIPIENKGTNPDIYRGITELDLRDSFQNYSYAVLESALEVLKGTDVLKIQELVTGSLGAQYSGHGISMSVPKELEESVDKFDTAVTTVEKGFKQAPQETVMKLGALYREVFDIIIAETPEGAEKAAYWGNLIVPLPEILKDADVLLRGLWRKGEVLERLADMSKLPRFKIFHPLIEVIVSKGNTVKGNIRFANPCERVLTNP